MKRKITMKHSIMNTNFLIISLTAVLMTTGCSNSIINTDSFNTESNVELESVQEFKVNLEYPVGTWDSIKVPNDSFKSREEFEKELFKTIDFIESDLNQNNWYIKYGDNLTGCKIIIKLTNTLSMGYGGCSKKPSTDGGKGITTTITLDKSLVEAGIDNMPHEVSHIINGLSFSYSLNEGLCEYVNRQITGKTTTCGDIPVDDKLKYSMDSAKLTDDEEVKNKMLNEMEAVIDMIGIEGQTYPYGTSSKSSSMWFCFSESFVSYIMNQYGKEAFMELFLSGKSEEDYKVLDKRGFEAIKKDWINYLQNYNPTMSQEEMNGRIEEMQNKMKPILNNAQ